MTYHRVTLFAIPEFKSLEVLKKFFLHYHYCQSTPKITLTLTLTLIIKKKTQKKKLWLKSIKNRRRRDSNPKLRHGRHSPRPLRHSTTITKPCLKTVFNIVAWWNWPSIAIKDGFGHLAPWRNWTLLSPTLTSNWLPSPCIHHPWPEFELLGEGGSGPQTISAKTLEFQIRIRPSIV